MIMDVLPRPLTGFAQNKPLNAHPLPHRTRHKSVRPAIRIEEPLVMPLVPGDAIPTGTPGTVVPVQPGDVVEILVDGIGTLSNPVVRP
ncbi:hypothetical protein AMK09_33710 [Streptomyces sp. CB02488]|nr:hypothetical protein AMK09_33710 [Streptomyces sp. CB02488]